MSAAVELVKAVLRDACRSEAEAQQVLEQSKALAVDVLDYCAHRCGLGLETTLERAAAWTGLGFSPVVPRTVTGSSEFRRLDSLGDVRTIRTRLFDRDISYLAPRFDEMLQLRERLEQKPELVGELCIVPGRGALSSQTIRRRRPCASSPATPRWSSTARAMASMSTPPASGA